MKVKKKQLKFKTTKEVREEVFNIMKNIPEITVSDEYLKAKRPELSDEQIKELAGYDPLASAFYEKYKSLVINKKFAEILKKQSDIDDLAEEKNSLLGEHITSEE